MKWFVSLRARLMLLALVGVSISGIGFLITTGYTQWRIRRAVGTEISQLGESDCRHSVQAMYLMVRSIDEQTKVQLGEALAGCRHLVQQQGGLLQAAETVTWNAVNQLSKEKQEVVLPRLVLGQQWLGQVSDPAAPVPLLDAFAHSSSAKCTIFQRMNAKGDMLRVATNVVNKEGKRAIGTYIPAADPAGKPSEVIASVLAGKTYKGRAYVVDRWYQTFYEPFHDAQGSVIGMLYVGLPLEGVASLRAGINDFKLGTSGYVYVLGGSGEQKGDYVISPGGKRDGQNLLDHARKELHPALTELIERPVHESSFEKPVLVRYAWRNPEDPAERQKIAAAIYYEPWDWIICASVYEDEYFAGMAKLNQFLSGLSMISLALIAALLAASAVFGRTMASRILRPIEAMRERVKDLVAGEGDLTLRIQADGGDEIAALGGQFNLFLEHIHHLMKQVAQAGEQVAALSGEISQNNDQVSGTIQHQNQQLEQITAAIEEMSGSVTEVAIQTASAAEHATTTGRIADQGGEVIRHSLEDMDIILQAVIAGSDSLDQLAHRGDEIGGVIDMIKNIADQTNLLALNAAIEAARAGEHGRGFAVVASEVRLLAERTKDATGQIGSTIRVIQEETTDAKTRMSKDRGRADGAREAAQQVTVNLERIVTSSKDVAMLIQSIAAAVEEQSTTSSQITCAVSELHRGAQSTLGAAEHATQAAHGLNVVADDLRDLIGRFKL